eukprot:1799412-Alexandrium_andersonii.AAC.1
MASSFQAKRAILKFPIPAKSGKYSTSPTTIPALAEAEAAEAFPLTGGAGRAQPSTKHACNPFFHAFTA